MSSKLGYHINLVTHEGQVQKMLDSQPSVLKVISNMGLLRELHSAFGDKTVFIARDWQAGDDFLSFFDGDVKSSAYRWFNLMRPAIEQAPFAYWESFNEPVLDRIQMKAYSYFESERQIIMHRAGYKCCIGNFAVGNPEIVGANDLWPYFYDALEFCHIYKNILGLHEYGGLYMDMWYGQNNHESFLNNTRVPFPETRDEGWLFGRYRKVWNKHLEPMGYTNIRIALNEFGLDKAGTPTVDALRQIHKIENVIGSWKTCSEAWKIIDRRSDTAQFYFEQLKWANSQMQKDDYLIGATIFTWGTPSDSLWMDWDIDGEVADKVNQHIKLSRNTEPPIEESFKLRWPTQYPRVTQIFGDNYSYYWNNFRLPGHEGIDIQAPYGSDIYACADGVVIAAYYAGAYGRQVRIQHENGYQTIYAHLASYNVGIGSKVVAGQLIGKADSTGNSSGSHLHLTLKKAGATKRGETPYPNDIIDPTPYLLPMSMDVAKVRTTAARGQFIRSGAGANYRAIASVFPNHIMTTTTPVTELPSLILAGKWIPVKLENGTEGWAMGKYLEII